VRALVLVIAACGSAAPPPVANHALPVPPRPRDPICVERASLDTTGIKHAITEHRDAFAACYADFLQDHATDAGGRVVATFTIGPDGHVRQAEVTGIDPILDRCVCQVIAHVELPAIPRVGSVVVNYPFVFTPR
jgi:TonB-like protein